MTACNLTDDDCRNSRSRPLSVFENVLRMSFPVERFPNSVKFWADGNATAKSLASVEKSPPML